MIRFQPDSWLEALLRFFAMAAPDGNVYVEIPAPDLRFAAIVLLAVLAAWHWRRLRARPRAAFALLTLVVVATVPWLVTSGNGRYWMPMLLAAGPLAVGLVYVLPMTKAFRLFLASGLLVCQGFAVVNSSPLDSWTLVAWNQAPYFHVELPKQAPGALPVTYVTLTSISYSLIAPQFPASSRWINITNLGGTVRDASWGQRFLAQAPGPIMLIVPTVKGQVTDSGDAMPSVRKLLDELMSGQRLALVPDARCQLLRARSMLPDVHGQSALRAFALSQDHKNAGFWVCPLRYPIQVQDKELHLPPRHEAAFARIEQMCPRFFPPGARSAPVQGGAVRHYAASDMRAYVLDNGEVWYKFWRALNPVLVGSIDAVLDGSATIQCDRIRGRSGLPWEREI